MIKKRLGNWLFIGFILFFFSRSFSQSVTPLDVKMAYRAVWAHPGYFGADAQEGPAKIQKVLDNYVQAGINTVIILVKNTSGHVYYKTDSGVVDPAWNWDFFDVFFKEAQKRKIEVHPWFCVFPETSILGKVREHPEWLIVSPKGEMVPDANPALPEVRAYELGLMMEVVKRYPVDWIHLDYIRFPCSPSEPYFSFDAKTRSLFKEYSGFDPLTEIRAKDSGNMIWNEWLEWNRRQVTLFVRELKDALTGSGRTVKISAAVFPNAENAKVLIGQDWPKWVDEGLIDMLCPMLYTNHTVFFEKFVRAAAAIAKGRTLLLPGIGIGTSHNQNTPDGMALQIKISKSLGCDGVVFFSSSSLNDPFLEKLKTLR